MEQHEKMYQKLRESSYLGWGGKNYENRMQGWDQALEKIELYLSNTHSILEMGCGAGDVSLKLVQKGYRVTGIDFSETAIKWAKEKSQGLESQVQFYQDSATNTDILMSQKFDLIIDGNCLHCLFDDDRDNFYKNINRLLKREGYLFISTAIKYPNKNEPKISSLPRCLLTEEELMKEFKTHNLEMKIHWLSDENHLHFYGLLKKVY